MALNEGIKFQEFPREHQAAFGILSTPRLVKLPVGMKLYKFNNNRSLHDGYLYGNFPPGQVDNYKARGVLGKTSISPWWSPFESYEQDAGWVQRTKIAEANGVSIKEWGRLTSAIREDWNSLAYLLWIVLNQETSCFFGGFRKMVRITPGKEGRMTPGEGKNITNKTLPGGGTQFYIPYMTPKDIKSYGTVALDGTEPLYMGHYRR